MKLIADPILTRTRKIEIERRFSSGDRPGRIMVRVGSLNGHEIYPIELSLGQASLLAASLSDLIATQAP